MSSIIEIDDNNFEEEVLKSDNLVLVKFWADWCGPCKMLASTINEVANTLPKESNIKLVKVNVDHAPNIANQYGVRSIPTMILFKDGKALDTKIGSMPKATLTNWIDSNHKSNEA